MNDMFSSYVNEYSMVANRYSYELSSLSILLNWDDADLDNGYFYNINE